MAIDDDDLTRELREFARQAKIPTALPDVKPRDPRDARYPGGVVPDSILAAREAAEVDARQPGRPKRGHGVPWEEIEQIFIHGEPYESKDGVPLIRHPSAKELGDRYNVTAKTIRRRAKRDAWEERRDNVRNRQSELISEALIMDRVERQIDARQMATEACEMLIGQVSAAIQEGKFSVNTPRELDTVVRLLLKLQGDADKVHQHNHNHVHDLSTLQARFADSRQRHARLPSEFGTAQRRGEMPALPIDVDISEFDEG